MCCAIVACICNKVDVQRLSSRYTSIGVAWLRGAGVLSPMQHPPTMSSTTSSNFLRLVGNGDTTLMDDWAKARRARQDVISENRSASSNARLDPADPRWVLAARAYSQLQSGALSPERRERVMRTSRHLGIRPFDANLIIALVQDHARSGRDLSSAHGVLRLVQSPARKQESRQRAARNLAIAVLCAAALNFALVWWLLSGSAAVP